MVAHATMAVHATHTSPRPRPVVISLQTAWLMHRDMTPFTLIWRPLGSDPGRKLRVGLPQTRTERWMCGTEKAGPLCPSPSP